jgi:alpha-galactosidase
VIHKLATCKKSTHIPFRDSKLTRLLAPSLTTSRNTLIICTISPAEINFSQTLSTLRFATQSRKIELRGLDESLNESLDVNRRKISRLMEENSLLKKNLSFAQDSRDGEEKYV